MYKCALPDFFAAASLSDSESGRLFFGGGAAEKHAQKITRSERTANNKYGIFVIGHSVENVPSKVIGKIIVVGL